MYKLLFSKPAPKDAEKIKKSKLSTKCQHILEIIELDPWSETPPYEKLIGDLEGFYSRRINIQHRLVYEVNEAEKLIKILRMWSHYE
jgi:Txe/YoeB family toxin of toxin-antitoxin system